MTDRTKRVYLHLGSPKTGTTYLQDVLWRNRESLKQQGVLYPGQRPEDHFFGTMDLQQMQFQDDWFDEKVPGAWTRLVDEARDWPATVVLSHELLCTASEDEVERALGDLAFAEVHLVCTARDLARQLPAVWQEDVKNRHTLSYTEFSRGVFGDDDPPHWLSELFWERQDLPRVLARWARRIPPERVHLVTVPPPDRPFDLLWARFAGLIGIDPCSSETRGGAKNASLGVAEVELVRRLNTALEGRLRWPDHDIVVKDQLATRILGARKPQSRLEVPAEDWHRVRERAQRLVAELAAADYDVVGDLDELVPAADPPGGGPHPDHADEGQLIDVAIESLAGLIEHIAAEEAKGDHRPPPAPEGVRRTLVHLSEQHPVFSQARTAYRRLKNSTSFIGVRRR
ncbi:hypothetical protein [Saccharopolyspora griseoalba]|uniref:Sulfotransferase family protein n=1 Tax=Saccharopolyspora griseoalba TaxID=1431848 RepID=A0ABW2LEV4_9PSEU